MYRKRHRTTFNQQQLAVLEEAFKQNIYPSISFREAIAFQTNLDSSRVQVWFQNRRAKHKRQVSQVIRNFTSYSCVQAAAANAASGHHGLACDSSSLVSNMALEWTATAAVAAAAAPTSSAATATPDTTSAAVSEDTTTAATNNNDHLSQGLLSPESQSTPDNCAGYNGQDGYEYQCHQEDQRQQPSDNAHHQQNQHLQQQHPHQHHQHVRQQHNQEQHQLDQSSHQHQQHRHSSAQEHGQEQQQQQQEQQQLPQQQQQQHQHNQMIQQQQRQQSEQQSKGNNHYYNYYRQQMGSLRSTMTEYLQS